MAWSWSHTDEAYSNARRNLEEMPFSSLREIYCEWEGFVEESIDDFDVEKYENAITNLIASPIPRDILAEEIWSRASDHGICDNGGFNAWMCPYGCPIHTVSFDRESAGFDECR